MRKLAYALSGSVSLLYATSAFAHPNHGVPHAHLPDGGLTDGLLHPVLGLDHLLAMVAVGLLAVQFSTRVKWFVPAAFVGGLLLGGSGGLSGWQMGFVEAGIALTLVVLGTAIAVGRQLPLAAVLPVVAVFGFMHGFAHGQEVPAIASPWLYVVGFTSATICLHLAGVGLGTLASQNANALKSLRVSGVAMAVFGLFLLSM